MTDQKTELQLSEGTKTALEKRGLDEAIWSAIGASIFPGASEESKLMAIDYCKARGLDIMKKPCHIVPMNVKDAKSNRYAWRDVIMPGIAEHRITATRTGVYAGQDPAEYGDFVELKIGNKKHSVPEFCCVTVHRLIDGVRVGFSHTEFFEEACGTTKDGNLNSMWERRKRGQLSKCAEAGALKKAFPEELGGLTTMEEVAFDEPKNVTHSAGAAVRKAPIDPFKQTEALPAAEPVTVENVDEKPAPAAEVKPVALVEDVEVTEAPEGSDQKWTRYRVHLLIEGSKFTATTFSTRLGGIAQSLIGAEVNFVLVEEDGKGSRLTDIAPVTTSTEGNS